MIYSKRSSDMEHTVELMTVEMLGARVTLAAAFMSTFKFAI